MPPSLIPFVDRFQNQPIIVWGDLILDEYVFTTTGRVSREAPVLVTEFESNEYRLGGAGNVVLNVHSLGAAPIPVGFIGRDEKGRILKKILAAKGIGSDYLIEVNGFRTPLKSRILSGAENTRKQQILRIDTLNRSTIPPAGYRRLEQNLARLLATHQALIVSDYLSQTVRAEVFARLRPALAGRIIAVDSRNHLLDFSGITVATPNESELRNLFPGRALASQENLIQAGTELLGRIRTEGIVLKRGHQGMMVFSPKRPPAQIPIFGTTQIVDMTGAGDTVLAVIGLGLLSGASLLDSARLGNIAGGMVVMKEGAFPIPWQELKDALR